MKTLFTTAALVALLAATPALAQNAEPAAPTEQQPPAATEAPAAPVEEQAPAATETPADDASKVLKEGEGQKGDTAEVPAAPDTQPAVAATDQEFLGQQADDQKLASSWIGQTIYNAADENIGDVNDLLLGSSGSVEAVIVGVGGFLGIGEKNVAVPLKAINASTDADGNMKLVIQASKEQLDAAPEFLTLADIKAREPVAPVTDPMAPAPAAPAEPAPAQ